MAGPKHSTYKVGEPIKFAFRVKGDPLTANPVVEVYDEVDVLFATLSASDLSQIGSTKLFVGEFTPDAEGEWTIRGTDDNGSEIVKQYPVGTFGVQDIGAGVATNEAKIDIINSKIDDLDLEIGDQAHFG